MDSDTAHEILKLKNEISKVHRDLFIQGSKLLSVVSCLIQSNAVLSKIIFNYQASSQEGYNATRSELDELQGRMNALIAELTKSDE